MKTWDAIDKAKQEKFIANNMESIYPHLKQNDCYQKLGAYLIVKSCNKNTKVLWQKRRKYTTRKKRIIVMF